MDLASIWEPFERLFVTFSWFLRFCWTALPLQRKPMFYRFGRSRAGTRPPLLQVWISGSVFVRFYAVFCDFGSPLQLLWAPSGTLLGVN